MNVRKIHCCSNNRLNLVCFLFPTGLISKLRHFLFIMSTEVESETNGLVSCAELKVKAFSVRKVAFFYPYWITMVTYTEFITYSAAVLDEIT